MNLSRKLIGLAIAVFLLAVALIGSATGRPMIIHVQDATGAPIPDIVVIITPGDQYKSLALLTGRDGNVKLSASQPKTCVVTAIDPRHLFFTRTTEAVCGGTSFVNIRLTVRPIIDTVANLTAIWVTIQVTGPNGKILRNSQVILRNRIGTMKGNGFIAVTTDRTGLIKVQLSPGKYVLAASIKSGFLEASFEVGADVQRKCSELARKCIFAAAKHVVFKKPIMVTLQAPTLGQ